MPATHTVIIHGWSDRSDSFVSIKPSLEASGVPNVCTLSYADDKSRQNKLSLDDFADWLNGQFIEQKFIDTEGNPLVDLNVLVHSTGGLVIRRWIARYYLQSAERLDLCPVKRIVMLAPAQVGSPYAQPRHSFVGSLLKGRFKLGDLRGICRQWLDSLNVGRHYQWRLAHRDLLCGLVPYSAERIQVTLLAGIKADLDSANGQKEAGAYIPYQWGVEKSVETFAWAVLPGLDERGIVEGLGQKDSLIAGLLLEALNCTSPAAFHQFCARTQSITAQTHRQNSNSTFQPFAFWAVGDQQHATPDFTFECFTRKAGTAEVERIVARVATDSASEVRANSVYLSRPSSLPIEPTLCLPPALS